MARTHARACAHTHTRARARTHARTHARIHNHARTSKARRSCVWRRGCWRHEGLGRAVAGANTHPNSHSHSHSHSHTTRSTDVHEACDRMIAGHCTALRPSHTRRKHGKGCGQVSTPHLGRRSDGKHCGHPSAVRCVSGLVQRVLCIGHSTQARDSHHRGQGLRSRSLAPIEEAQGAPERAPSTLVIGAIYWYNHISGRAPGTRQHGHPGPGIAART